MNIQHFEKGLQYTDRDLLLVARKLGKLATYCRKLKDASSSIRVEAARQDTKKERDQITVMITVDLPKAQLRAESRKPSLDEAIDRTIEKLEPQIKRYKEQRLDRGHGTRRRTQSKKKGSMKMRPLRDDDIPLAA